MFCQPGIAMYLKDYDYVVLNCGHHPAAKKEFTYSQYTTAVETLFRAIRSKYPKPSFKLFWLENVAIPLHQDHNVIFYKDWRTYHRLLLFDSIAKQAMKTYLTPVPLVVSAFQSTFALFDKHCDCGYKSLS